MIASKTDRSHFVLRWMIHSVGLIIAVCASLILLRFISVVFINWAEGEKTFGVFALVLVLDLALILILGLIAKTGWKMWRAVDTDAVTNFASLWALWAALDFYRLWPLHEAFFRFKGAGAFAHDPHDFGMLGAVLVFLLLNRLGKYGLIRLLKLDETIATKRPNPTESEIPEYPRRSPLLEL